MKRKTALYGLLIALAFIVSYLESLIPLPVAIQGIKLGLANGVVLVALYRLRWWDGLVVSVLRILLAGLTFGSPVSMLYSLSGGLLSLGVMELCRRSGRFSVLGVSMAGGVSHNIGQLAAAAVLLPVGLLTGGLVGLLAGQLLPRLKKLS